MSAAICQQQFTLHYQARFGNDGSTIIGAEGLIRWNHPDKGLLYPGSFISLAEETGLIDELGEWVIKEGANQAARWFREGRNLNVSVNLSPSQFTSENFARKVEKILQKSGCPPKLLELEITESMLIHDIQRVADILRDLHALGVRAVSYTHLTLPTKA